MKAMSNVGRAGELERYGVKHRGGWEVTLNAAIPRYVTTIHEKCDKNNTRNDNCARFSYLGYRRARDIARRGRGTGGE